MKIDFEQQDIEKIAQRVAEFLKPLLLNHPRARSECEGEEFLSVEEATVLLKTTKGQIYQWVNNAQHGLSDFPFLRFGAGSSFQLDPSFNYMKSIER